MKKIILVVIMLLILGCFGKKGIDETKIVLLQNEKNESTKQKRLENDKNEILLNNNIFYDDFENTGLDANKWLVANKQWGGNGVNGGIVPENVYVKNGKLILEAHGDNYTGDILGINKDKSKRTNGKRVGGGVATRKYFASGSYETRMKLIPKLGVCSAIWTFHYQEFYPNDSEYIKKPVGGNDWYAINHEIDIEFPGRPKAAHSEISYEYALFNSWIGENTDEYTVTYNDLNYNYADGKFHTYRFDWHTGSEGELPRVEFYIDNNKINTIYNHIPKNAGRLWIASWFPDGWAGTPKFDTEYLEVDWVKITPFNEQGDIFIEEHFANDHYDLNYDYNYTNEGSHDNEDNKNNDTDEKTDDDNTNETDESDESDETNIDNRKNILKNGDFEKNTLENWNVVGTGKTEISDSTVIEGNFSLLLVPTKVDTAKVEQTVDGLRPNTEYILKSEMISEGAFAYIGIKNKGEQGTDKNEKTSIEYKFKTNIDETSVTIYISVWKQQMGKVIIDNVKLFSFEEIEDNNDDKDNNSNNEDNDSEEKIALKNGDFEKGSLEDWEVAGTGKTEIINNNVIEGNYSLELNPSENDIARVEQTVESLEPNTEYILRSEMICNGVYGYIGIKNKGEKGTNNNEKAKIEYRFKTDNNETSVTIYISVWKQQIGKVIVDDIFLSKIN